MSTEAKPLMQLLKDAPSSQAVTRWMKANCPKFIPGTSKLELMAFYKKQREQETEMLQPISAALCKAQENDRWPLTVVRPLSRTILYTLVLAEKSSTLKISLAALNWHGIEYLDFTSAEALTVVRKVHEKERPAITLTFGDVAENNVGMEKIGTLASEGFTVDDLKAAKKAIEARKQKGVSCELIDLSPGLQGTKFAGKDYGAYILLVRGAVPLLTAEKKGSAKRLLNEQLKLDWDTKALMKGRVVDKKARHNLCYAESGQEPDYENGKGRIIAYDDVPLVKTLRGVLPQYFGEKAQDLMCEGNLYYDTAETGIGYHGDRERAKVIAVRLGEPIDLCYRWYHQSKWIGRQFCITLQPGDLYVMSDKSVGRDWLVKKVPTLRHSAGCRDYTNPEWKEGAPLWISRD